MRNATSAEQALLDAERDGLRITLTVRSGLVCAIVLFILGTQGVTEGAFGAGVGLVFLATGLGYRWLVVTGRDRQWMRFGFIALDLALLGMVATVVPLSLHGEVPQIFVFRVYGTGIFFFILATAALSLSPRLVLWTGLASVASMWGAWGWIVWHMERRVFWSELTEDRSAAAYIRIVLDPDHVGAADRAMETVLILCTAVVTAAAVHRARRLLREQVAAEQARGRVAEIFGHYVPERVVESLDRSGGVLSPRKREATILFVDIEGFTGFAERADPVRLVAVLDSFFDTVSACAAKHRGVVISLIGDAAMAAFNAPADNPNHAADALAAAIALLRHVETGRFAGERLAVRIGLATGDVAAGTVGGRGLRAYTLYGDTVNLAQRLEASNKTLGTRLLLAERTWIAAGRPPELAPVGEIDVKGRRAPVAVYSDV